MALLLVQGDNHSENRQLGETAEGLPGLAAVGQEAGRRAKAVFWWRCMHAEHPLGAAEILASMPTDDDIVELYRQAACNPQRQEGPAQWGDGLVWAELRRSLSWRIEWE